MFQTNLPNENGGENVPQHQPTPRNLIFEKIQRLGFATESHNMPSRPAPYAGLAPASGMRGAITAQQQNDERAYKINQG